MAVTKILAKSMRIDKLIYYVCNPNKIDFGDPYGRQRAWVRIPSDPSPEEFKTVQLPLGVFD